MRSDLWPISLFQNKIGSSEAHHTMVTEGTSGQGSVSLSICVSTVTVKQATSQGLLDSTPGASTACKQLLRTDARVAESGQTCCRCACTGQREGMTRFTRYLLNACFVRVLHWTHDRIPAIGHKGRQNMNGHSTEERAIVSSGNG